MLHVWRQKRTNGNIDLCEPPPATTSPRQTRANSLGRAIRCVFGPNAFGFLHHPNEPGSLLPLAHLSLHNPRETARSGFACSRTPPRTPYACETYSKQPVTPPPFAADTVIVYAPVRSTRPRGHPQPSPERGRAAACLGFPYKPKTWTAEKRPLVSRAVPAL